MTINQATLGAPQVPTVPGGFQAVRYDNGDPVATIRFQKSNTYVPQQPEREYSVPEIVQMMLDVNRAVDALCWVGGGWLILGINETDLGVFDYYSYPLVTDGSLAHPPVAPQHDIICAAYGKAQDAAREAADQAAGR